VGLAALRGSIATYADRWELLELAADGAGVPAGKRLRAWRKQAGPRLVFSVALPARAAALTPGSDFDEAVEHGIETARLLEARCVILRTPASIRPTSTNRKRIALALEKVPREAVIAAWEPSGVWERDELIAFARDAGIVPVVDPTQARIADGAVVYVRIRAAAGRLGPTALARLGAELRGRREAFVVVEAAGEARRVRAALGEAAAPRPAPKAGAIKVVRPTQPLLVAEDEEQ
jgi:uncharacterized protein YecE (DUF72 family)